MDDVIKTVTSATRDGGIADLTFETVDGASISIKFDIRYLWAVAADLRAASIDLLAPVPEALKAATSDAAELGQKDDGIVEQAGGQGAEKQEEPKSGFAGLEQAWILCDALNQAHLENVTAGPDAILREIATGHFLIEEDGYRISSADGKSPEVMLANEFKIVFRPETNDWVPDRKTAKPEEEPESA